MTINRYEPTKEELKERTDATLMLELAITQFFDIERRLFAARINLLDFEKQDKDDLIKSYDNKIATRISKITQSNLYHFSADSN